MAVNIKFGFDQLGDVSRRPFHPIPLDTFIGHTITQSVLLWCNVCVTCTRIGETEGRKRRCCLSLGKSSHQLEYRK
jgi:hypothetical protein